MESFSLLSAMRWFRESADAVVYLESRGEVGVVYFECQLFKGFGEKLPS